jgi:hypothetical protein
MTVADDADRTAVTDGAARMTVADDLTRMAVNDDLAQTAVADDAALTTTDEAAAESQPLEIAPGPFCALLLKALEAAEGQTRRRKRDQAPDRLGLAIKRDLLERGVADAPSADDFEGWLVAQIAGAPVAGSVRAMCEQIFLEYRMVRFQPDLAGWLAQGAPSDDADRSRPDGGSRKRDRAHDRLGDSGRPDRWHGTDDAEYACTCHLPTP